MYYDYLRWRSFLIGFLRSKRGVIHLGFHKNLSSFIKSLHGEFGSIRRAPEMFRDLKEDLLRYLSGERILFDRYPLDLRGTEFQLKVWLKVKEIPYGETRTYKWVAEEIENPRAYRAVGNALKRNPIMLIIPCHRVIRSDGRLGGWRHGGGLRRLLLKIEGVEI